MSARAMEPADSPTSPTAPSSNGGNASSRPSIRVHRHGDGANRRGSFHMVSRVPKARRRSVVATALRLNLESRRSLEQFREEVFALVWRGKAFSISARAIRLFILGLIYFSLLSLVTETVEFQGVSEMRTVRDIGVRVVEYLFGCIMAIEFCLRLWTADLDPAYPASFVAQTCGMCICVDYEKSADAGDIDADFPAGKISPSDLDGPQTPFGGPLSSVRGQTTFGAWQSSRALGNDGSAQQATTPGGAFRTGKSLAKSNSTRKVEASNQKSAFRRQDSRRKPPPPVRAHAPPMDSKRSSFNTHGSESTHHSDNEEESKNAHEADEDPETKRMALAIQIRRELQQTGKGLKRSESAWMRSRNAKEQARMEEAARAKALLEDNGTCRGCMLHCAFYVSLPRLMLLSYPSILFDLLVLAPILVDLTGIVDVFDDRLPLSNWFRMIRAVRLFKFMRYTPSLAALFAVFSIKSEELLTALLISSSFILIMAFTIHAAEHDSNEDFPDLGASLYHSVVTITSIGYGDLAPITTQGRFATSLLAVMGTSFYSCLLYTSDAADE